MKKTIWMSYRICAFLSALLLVICELPLSTVFAAETAEVKTEDNAEEKTEAEAQESVKEYTTIEIYTAEDLVQFSQNCHTDSWSKDKKVILMEDISLKNVDFSMIPVFEGIFDGNNHTINDWIYKEEGYVTGLFRYIGENGVVKNLTVTGTIKVTGEKKCVGGICGENSGSIRNCSFQGTIEGNTETGGIAGINTATGNISGCSSHGNISGYYSTGGIVGKNHGSISNCSNQAGINNKISWVEQDDENGLDWIKGFGSDEDLVIQSGVDTGGIAGFSDGVISACSNFATIGYEHTGYNVGGIVGRQSGVTLLCRNDGKILGRKDIGGIVGQMEPYIKLNEAESVEEAVQLLHDLIDKTLDDLDTTRAVISADCDTLESYSDSALDKSHTIVTMMSDFVDDNITAINQVSDRIRYVIDNIPDALDKVDNAIDGMKAVNEDLKKINEDLDLLGKMQDSEYEVTDYERLGLTTGVGGSLSADNKQPEQGETVTITVRPDNGYVLNEITAVDRNGNVVSLNGGGTEYTLEMPEENVSVKATFAYSGEYLAASTAGGTITVTEEENQVIIRSVPQGGYGLTALTVGGKQIDLSAMTDNTITLNKADYPADGNPVMVEGVYEKKNNAHSVSADASTGGTIVCDSSTGVAGDTITVTAQPLPKYKLGELTVNGISILASLDGTRSYKFTMPDDDAKVEGFFVYEAEDSDKIYCESTVGGSIIARETTASEVYRITMIPSGGFGLDTADGKCLAVYDRDGALIQSFGIDDLTESNGNYSVSVNVSGAIQPVKVYGKFAGTNGNYTIDYAGSTGGTVIPDKNSAAGGDLVRIATTTANGYYLNNLKVTASDGGEVPYEVTSDEGVYSFTMPDSAVMITAEFEPVCFIMVSNAGGKASYSSDGNRITFTVTPDAGCTVDALKVTDASGNNLPVSKVKADSFEYECEIIPGVPVRAEITFASQSQYDSIQSAKDTIQESSENLSNSMENCQQIVENMRDILLDENGEVIDWEDLSDEDKDSLIQNILDLAVELSESGDAAAKIISSASLIGNIAGDYLADTAEILNDDLTILTDDIQAVLDDIDAANDIVQGIVDYLKAQSRIRFTQLGDEFDANVNSLYDQLQGISDSMSKIGDDIDHYSEILNDDFRAVNDQLNVVLMLFIDNMEKIQNPDSKNIYEDVSDEDIEDTQLGLVEQCVNYGRVCGDIDVGGVAGSLSIDEEDLEGNAAGKVNVSLGSTYLTKCVLNRCKNYGYVTAKKDGAGCIAGYMNLGVASECEAYGGAESTEGGYVGGICGQSMGIIRKSYALCSLQGKSYVGGIAGYADAIYDCYAMADTEADEGRVGAIAGQTGIEKNDGTGTQEDHARGNYYVGDGIYGIDNISYVGVAEPITYEELLAVEGLPNDFRHLKVTYVIDEEIVSTEEVSYNTPLSELTMPEIPMKGNENGIWPDVSERVMDGNILLEAEYRDNITVLTSEETDSGKALALAEGVYTDESELHAVVSQIVPPKNVAGDNQARVLEISLENTTVKAEDETQLRLLQVEGENDTVWYYDESGQWTELDAGARGQYLQVAMTGNQGVFCIAPAKRSLMKTIIIALGAGFAVLLCAGIIVKKKHSNR